MSDASKRENIAPTQSLATTPPKRVIGRPFQPGNVANPNGRPEGLGRMIRKATANGQEIVDFVLDVFRGDEDKLGRPVKLELRYDAANWLADRGFGKPVQSIEHSGVDGAPIQLLDLTVLSVADLEQLEDIAARGTRQLGDDSIIDHEPSPTSQADAT